MGYESSYVKTVVNAYLLGEIASRYQALKFAPFVTLLLYNIAYMYSEQVQHSDLRLGKARSCQRYMEKCLRQWSEHTLSGVRSSSCRSTLPQAPKATGPRCPQCSPVCASSLACAAIFVATSHVLYNAPSSTNVIVDVDGLLQETRET